MPPVQRHSLSVLAGLARRYTFQVVARADDEEALHEELDPDDPGVGWTAEAEEGAFDAEGVLVHPFRMFWSGYERGVVQVALARAGLPARLERESGEDDGCPGGLAVCSPDDTDDSDLARILRCFDELNRNGVVALASTGFTRSNGWDDVRDAALGRDDCWTSGASGARVLNAIFWVQQVHDAFDDRGNLGPRKLVLYWSGERDKIAAALRQSGLIVESPAQDDTAFVLRRPAAT